MSTTPVRHNLRTAFAGAAPARFAGAALAAGLVLTACTGGDDPGTQTAVASPEATTDSSAAPDSSAAASPDASSPDASSPGTTGSADATGGADATSGPEVGTVTALDAIELALAEVPGAVVELDLDTEAGERVWEVSVLTTDGAGVEVTLSVANGEVRNQEPTDLDSEQRTAPPVTASDAIETALAAVPGEVEELDLDTEGGRVVWEVEIRDATGDTDVIVDATSGEILSQ